MAPLAVCCHGVGHDILIKLVNKIRVLRFVFPAPNTLLVNWKRNLHSQPVYIFKLSTYIKKIADIYEIISFKIFETLHMYVKFYERIQTLVITMHFRLIIRRARELKKLYGRKKS